MSELSAIEQSGGVLTVGFDLDLTLADTSEGILAALDATAKETGVAIDLEAARARLGIPIQEELAHHFSLARVEAATTIFRYHLGKIGVGMAVCLPGAHRAVERVHEIGGRSLVITTKQRGLALATLTHIGIKAGEVIGNLHGDGKADALREARAWGYVGDHINDMLAARLAGVVAVGITTGNHSADELYEAGAHHVLETLEEFAHLLDEATAAQP
jgi:phosphoglycolate phosphatase